MEINRKLLVIYDTSTQPISIGDFATFVQTSIIKKISYSVDKIDFCFLLNPAKSSVAELDNLIDDNNKMYFLFSIMPILQFNPYISNIFVIESKDELYDLLEMKKSYYIWPSVQNIDSSEYLYYKNYILINEFYRLNGYIPQLLIPKQLKKWSEQFIIRNGLGKIPVTVNIRRNLDICPERNSDYEAWKGFFSYCEDKYPVVFFVICSTSEIEPEWRKLTNVIFVKDFNTQIDKEISLIYFSAFHLGSSSGPSIVAHFGNKPYLTVNINAYKYLDTYQGSLVQKGDFLFPSFAKKNQINYIRKETSEFLIKNFKQLYNSIDVEVWNKETNDILQTEKINDWLR